MSVCNISPLQMNNVQPFYPEHESSLEVIVSSEGKGAIEAF